jgi:hypothetical protein
LVTRFLGFLAESEALPRLRPAVTPPAGPSPAEGGTFASLPSRGAPAERARILLLAASVVLSRGTAPADPAPAENRWL